MAPAGGSIVTPVVVVEAAKSQPPAGLAPAVEPAGVPFGTTCLTTEIDPWQLPSASARSVAAAAV